MAGDKVNTYAQDDSDILALQLTTDKTFKGYHQLTLTEYDTTTVPAIAAGSAIECNGALYKFDTEEAISTTDPVTSATVADGTVYVCIIPGTTTCTAAFTATAPTWSDSKQGWYGTGGQVNYRYLEFQIIKSGSSYIKERIYMPLDDQDVIFLAYANGTQSNPGSSTNIYFDNVIIDKYSIYTSGTHSIAMPLVNGFYIGFADVSYSGSFADQLNINGSGKIGTNLKNHSTVVGEIWSSAAFAHPCTVRFVTGTTVGTIQTTSYFKIKRVARLI